MAGATFFTFGFTTLPIAAWFGVISLLLIIATASAGMLRNVKWAKNNWYYVHLLNYVLFLTIWVHSWVIGTDIQTTNLRYLWIFIGVTGVVSAFARFYRGAKNRRRVKKLQAKQVVV